MCQFRHESVETSNLRPATRVNRPQTVRHGATSGRLGASGHASGGACPATPGPRDQRDTLRQIARCLHRNALSGAAGRADRRDRPGPTRPRRAPAAARGRYQLERDLSPGSRRSASSAAPRRVRRRPPRSRRARRRDRGPPRRGRRGAQPSVGGGALRPGRAAARRRAGAPDPRGPPRPDPDRRPDSPRRRPRDPRHADPRRPSGDVAGADGARHRPARHPAPARARPRSGSRRPDPQAGRRGRHPRPRRRPPGPPAAGRGARPRWPDHAHPLRGRGALPGYRPPRRSPRPRVNSRLHGYEVDSHWPDERAAVEIDGFRFHSSRRAFEHDRRKDAALQAAGIVTLRLTWRQIADEAIAVAARVAQRLAWSARRIADSPEA